jgi:hypothetical protein
MFHPQHALTLHSTRDTQNGSPLLSVPVELRNYIASDLIFLSSSMTVGLGLVIEVWATVIVVVCKRGKLSRISRSRKSASFALYNLILVSVDQEP